LPQYWYDESMAGGGAMMDLGCHPMYGVSFLCGRPKRIASVFNHITDRAVDDNAASLIEFENKCIALVETALVSYHSPSSFEVYGTKGTLIDRDGQALLMAADDSEEDGYVEIKDLPQALPSPMVMFLDACVKGSPIEFGLDAARDLTELLEKAYIANKNNTVEVFDEA
jgi:predicted dehydrogenase